MFSSRWVGRSAPHRSLSAECYAALTGTINIEKGSSGAARSVSTASGQHQPDKFNTFMPSYVMVSATLNAMRSLTANVAKLVQIPAPQDRQGTASQRCQAHPRRSTAIPLPKITRRVLIEHRNGKPPNALTPASCGPNTISCSVHSCWYTQ